MIQEQLRHEGDSWILSDPELLAEPELAMFSPDYWRENTVGQAPGRGMALFVDYGEQHWVLRHYRRGGLPGRLVRERYLYTGLDQSRPFREWRALAQAFAEGVPVPRPVACALHRHPFAYSADILLERIDGAASLADLLAQNAMSELRWQKLAAAIADCHRAGYWHADLNARNVICAQDQWWLIDFDRARKRVGDAWREKNLQRLQRSLDKLKKAGELQYSATDWQAFRDHYQKHF